MICGKVIYATQGEAIKAIHGLRNDFRKNNTKLPSKAYYCGDCNGFHLQTEGKRSERVKSKNAYSEEIVVKKTKHEYDPNFYLTIHNPRKFKVK